MSNVAETGIRPIAHVSHLQKVDPQELPRADFAGEGFGDEQRKRAEDEDAYTAIRTPHRVVTASHVTV